MYSVWLGLWYGLGCNDCGDVGVVVVLMSAMDVVRVANVIFIGVLYCLLAGREWYLQLYLWRWAGRRGWFLDIDGSGGLVVVVMMVTTVFNGGSFDME